MTDFSGTMQPDEDPLEYRRDETPVDREISRLRIDMSNQIADLSHRLSGLQKTVMILTNITAVTLLVAVLTLAACGFLVLSR